MAHKPPVVSGESLCVLTCPHEALLAQTWACCCRSAGCRAALRASIRGVSVWGVEPSSVAFAYPPASGRG